MPAQHRAIGPLHPNERRGLQAVLEGLPSSYIVYSNVEMPTGRGGQTFEHDLLILTPFMVFTVEMKSWGGRISGNRDRWRLEGGSLIQSPIPLSQLKARVLATQLRQRDHRLRRVWVQALIFVTGLDARLDLSSDYAELTCTLNEIIPALTTPSLWGQGGRRLSHQQSRAILEVFGDGRAAQLSRLIGPFKLLERLEEEEGSPYTAWRAERYGEARRVHIYELSGDDEKLRQRRRALAKQETRLQERLRGGPDLLTYREVDQILEPQELHLLSFEDSAPLLPLPSWLQRHQPSAQERLIVAARICRALLWIHRQEILHRRLSPEAVLLSDDPCPKELKLCALNLARMLSARASTLTRSRQRLPYMSCLAPEFLRSAEASKRSDRFSLGATLFELFQGHPLFERPEEVLSPYRLPPLQIDGLPAPESINLLLTGLLSPDPMLRPSLSEALEILEAEALPQEAPARRVLVPGEIICRVYELQRHLGIGATSSNWLLRHRMDGRLLVAKILPAEQLEALALETEVLRSVTQPNLPRYHSQEPFEGGSILLLEYAEGLDGRSWVEAGQPLGLAQLLTLGRGLFAALGALHQQGWLHRDVKPENLLIRASDAWPTLIDLGLARAPGEGELSLGSVAYKDPQLFEQGRWEVRDDLFAAWLCLAEILTGLHPFHGRAELGERPELEAEALPEGLGRAQRAALYALLQRSLDPDPSARPQSALEAGEALEEALTRPVALQEESSSPEPSIEATAQPLQSLMEFDEALRQQLGQGYTALNRAFGLQGQAPQGKPPPLEPLREEGGAGAELMELMEEALPPCGFSSLEAAAEAMSLRLPIEEGLSALGYSRLAAALLQDQTKPELLIRPPWTLEKIEQLSETLRARASWPPLPRAEALELLMERAAELEMRHSLRLWGAGGEGLLRACLERCPEIRSGPSEALFTPPVSFSEAFSALHPQPEAGQRWSAIKARLSHSFGEIQIPDDLEHALEAQGWRLEVGALRPLRREEPSPEVKILLDEDLPQRQMSEDGSLNLSSLLESLPQGGFRVLALPPGRHHLLSERIGAALLADLGAERLRQIDIDRVLIEGLRAADLWEDALFFEQEEEPSWGWAEEELIEALEAAILEGARQGILSLLIRPSLLGSLGLMDWLSGFYERARGGRYGLIVLALPGGAYEGRLRLNERHPLPYTPDMAAVVIREEGWL